MTLSLLAARRFGPLFWTQFLGALNDNLFKSALVVTVTFHVAHSGGGLSLDALVNAATALLILPFFLFSALAGQMADRFDKAALIRRLKGVETAVMLLAAAGFLTGSLPVLFGALFLMGAQSAFFGPLKYGILPQHLREEELVAANGLVEAGTFAGILLGTIAGGLVVAGPMGSIAIAAATSVVAVAGWITSRRIPAVPSLNRELKIDRNPLLAISKTVRSARADRTVWGSVLGLSWFWFVGALVVAQLPLLAKETLGADELTVTWLLTVFSFGVGMGSVSAEKLTGGKVELALVPIAGALMALFLFDFGWTAAHSGVLSYRLLLDLFAVGASGGLFAVPLYALMQKRAPEDTRSQVIAANNLVNALWMVLASVFAVSLRAAGLSIANLLIVTALLHGGVVVFMATRLQLTLLRILVKGLIRMMYRVRVRGLGAIPETGAALLVANHPSFADAVILGGLCHRPARFVMHHRIYNNPVLNWFFRRVGAIPIATRRENPEMLLEAMNSIDEALSNGELVVVFPEGKLTRDGEIDAFRPGVERILERRPVPVIPIALRGMWGSFFSFAGGHPMRKVPTRFRSRIEVIAGEVLHPSRVTAPRLQRVIGELRGSAR